MLGNELGVTLVRADGVAALVNALRKAHGSHRDGRRRTRHWTAITAALALGPPGACGSNAGVLNAGLREEGRPAAVADS